MSRIKHISNDLVIDIVSKRQYLDRLRNPNRYHKSVWLVVKNGGSPVSNCRVIVEGFYYDFQNEWIIAPNGYERKALKWRTRKDPLDGKVDITTKGSKQIEIVKASRRPNPHFIITYCKGVTGKTHHFVGKYKLRVKIEGKTAIEGQKWNIEPILYDIYFDYENTLTIKVKDIRRVTFPTLP